MSIAVSAPRRVINLVLEEKLPLLFGQIAGRDAVFVA